MTENGNLKKFIKDQLSVWPVAAKNFRSLKKAQSRSLIVNDLKIKLQYNPQRQSSTDAPEDEAAISARPCFLCEDGRMEGQRALKFDGRKGRKYDIALNPFPIFPRHLVIISEKHQPQTIKGNYVDLADLAHHYTDFSFFYNGPKSGASAPDHLHFQACPRSLLPLELEADRLLDLINPSDEGVPNGLEKAEIPAEISADIAYICSVQEAQLFHYKHFAKGVFFLRARTSKSMAKLFYRLLDCVDIREGEYEPRFNILTWYKSTGKSLTRPAGNTHGLADFEYRAVVVLRSEVRSSHYYSTDPSRHLHISPGCADIMGVFVTPGKETFEKAAASQIEEMLSEVCVSESEETKVISRLTRSQQTVSVGIMAAEEIYFEIISDGAGLQKVSCKDGRISYNGILYDEMLFEAVTPSTLFAEPTFILQNVLIGKGFHWERSQKQCFAGSLKFIVQEDKVVAVNIIGVEDYLLSVISSEMKASASLEFLKAHAVISRSWLLSQISHRVHASSPSKDDVATTVCGEVGVDQNESVYIKWFDREDHQGFDVCADDHCQRYQGLSLAIGEKVRQAVDQTWAEVLLCEGELADARFHKCCGGKTEIFSSCWEDKDYKYLQSQADTPGHKEGEKSFCDTADEQVLSQVLNDYDLETKDFFAWKAEYGREEISELVKRRSGVDFGTIRNLEAVERGPSGRITKLRIEGSEKTMLIGKELIIRKWLSESHLKSSAFGISWEGERLILEGRGWGHGAGLCQIGAAVMAAKGCNYKEILEHYYPNTIINKYD